MSHPSVHDNMPPLTERVKQLNLGIGPPAPGSRPLSAPLLSRSLYPPPISSPEPSLFLKIFRSISGLSIIGQYLSHIVSAWHWVRPRHELNTAIAQAKLDEVYWEEQNEIWERKHRLAERRARRLIAMKNPKLFLRAYILREDVGSPERKEMLALLKKYRPDVYKRWKHETGECLDDEDRRQGQDETHTEDNMRYS